MNIPDRTCLIRVYSNGKSSGVKFFVSTRMARALGIKEGDCFSIGRDELGRIELVPVAVRIDVVGPPVPIGQTVRSFEVPA